MIRKLIPFYRNASTVFKISVIALSWLVLISVLHFFLNGERRATNNVLMGYMPVITNLAAPIADAVSKDTDVRFEAMKFASFAEMAEAFRLKHIQVAFIIAPLAIEMYLKGTPLKVVYIGNRHESTFVVKKNFPGKTIPDLIGKTVAVPIRYSGHLLAIERYLREQGLDPKGIQTVEIPPPDMSSALAAGGIDGYFVGEPFASISIYNNIGKRLLDVESIWPRFICNLVIVHDDLIRAHPEWVQRLVDISVRSGLWAEKHIGEVTELISGYWNQDPQLIRYTFTHPPNRFRFDLYTPLVSELEEIAREMLKSGLIKQNIDLRGMVDDRFVKNVDIRPVDSLQEILLR